MSERHGSEAVDARPVRSADARQPGFGEVLAAADLPQSRPDTGTLTFASAGGHGPAHGKPQPSGLGKNVGKAIDFAEGRLYAFPGSIAIFGHTLYVGASEIKRGLDSTHNILLQTLIILTGIPATLIAAGIMAVVNLPVQLLTGHRVDKLPFPSFRLLSKKTKK